MKNNTIKRYLTDIQSIDIQEKNILLDISSKALRVLEQNSGPVKIFV